MPRKPHAAGCVVNSLSSNITTQYRGLWITDALLADTFHKFCHSPRRYGSNVPGPLEARRRASKRKNTNLAYAGAGQYVYDPAMMLGSGSRDQWWKKVETASVATGGRHGNWTVAQATEIEPESSLPVWLFGSARAQNPQRIPGDSCKGDAMSEEDLVVEKPVNVDTLKQQFRERVALATDLKSIQAVTKELSINTTRHPVFSQIAFGRLKKICHERRDISELMSALYDPVMNPPGSENHLTYIHHLCKRGVDSIIWTENIFPSSLKAIELGLMPIEDLRRIMMLLPQLYQRIGHDPDGAKLYADCHAIVHAIDRSNVLQLGDLGFEFFSSWCQKTHDATLKHFLCDVLWRLRAASGKTDLAWASELIDSRLQKMATASKSDVSRTIVWIKSLPSNLLGPFLILSTFRFVNNCCQDGSKSRIILERWSWILSYLRVQGMLDCRITTAAWTEATATGSCNLNAAQQLLTVIWILSRIFHHYPSAMADIANRSFKDEFDKVFGDSGSAGQFDYVTQIVMILDTLPLPQKDRMLQCLHNFSDVDLIKALGSSQQLQVLKHCMQLDYAQLKDNKTTRLARRDYPHIIQALSESINKDLQQFKAMAQMLILTNHENFRIVSRLLNYNTELKFAASRAWPSSIQHTTRSQHPNFTPNSVLSVLETLTMTLAVSPAVTPRSSFRHVYKMYLFLHKIGAPINPIIGRALWHAGVTRYGDVGAARTQVQWCLAKVRELEGKTAAEQILWNSGLRVAFVHDIVKELRANVFLVDVPRDLRGVEAQDDGGGHRVVWDHPAEKKPRGFENIHDEEFELYRKK